jgi:hypothetical protein
LFACQDAPDHCRSPGSPGASSNTFGIQLVSNGVIGHTFSTQLAHTFKDLLLAFAVAVWFAAFTAAGGDFLPHSGAAELGYNLSFVVLRHGAQLCLAKTSYTYKMNDLPQSSSSLGLFR